MKKKCVRRVLVAIGVLVLIAIVNFIPTLSLKTNQMSRLDGKWIDVYYETEAEAAKDVYEYAEQETAAIAERFGFSEAPDVNVYIYDHQTTMQTKKYGLIAPLLGLDWYIGDNIGTDVILTSPANPGKVHTYIEYIETTYGWNAVLNIIESGDYEAVFGKSKRDIYDEWVAYINRYYQ